MLNKEELKSALSNSKIQFWNLEEIQTQRKEFYLCKGEEASELNQSRMVRINDIFLEIWTTGAGDRLGYGKTRLNPTETLEAQVEKLIDKSQLASEEKWSPQDPVSKTLKPTAKLCAHQFLEDFDGATQNLKNQLASQINEVKEAEFNSAELFCSLSNHELTASNGFQTSYKRSKIYTEVCFSSSSAKDSQEFMETRWAVRPEDIDFKALCESSIKGSQGLLQAEAMPSGTYRAKLRDEDLGLILSNIKMRFSGASRYKGIPFFEKGGDLIQSFEGQPFEIRLNPSRDFGINSLGFDSWGHKEDALLLVADNSVKNNSYSQKFAQYLGQSPNTSDGVLEIIPQGGAQEPPDEYLEILQFSGLFVDEISMTFSSEIRLARLVKKDGTQSYLKGGNFSGSFKENFSKVIWADQMSLVGVEGDDSIYLPEYAFLNDVSVS